MAKDRTELHELLVGILGSRYVYYQPPESLKLNYPCIIYSISDDRPVYADNNVYKYLKRYTITIIDADPDSVIPDKMLSLRYCSRDNSFVSDNLNHFVFSIYF